MQRTAAAGADHVVDIEPHIVTWQMVGQRLAMGGPFGLLVLDPRTARGEVRATEETAPALDRRALITIAFEAYSDAALRRAEVSHTAAPDPATATVALGAQTGLGARRPPL